MMRFTVMLLALFVWVAAQGQKAVSQQVSKARAAGQFFEESPLLKFKSNDVSNREYQLEGLSRGAILSIDQDAIESLVRNKTDYISMPVPTSDRAVVNLTLVRHEILAGDFQLFASDLPGVPVDYVPGVFYKGIVEGDPTSLVAISIFNDEIMGIISTSKGNMVLGKITNDRESRHILYNDADLDRKSDFVCGTSDDGLPYSEEDLNPSQDGRDVGDCVRVYIEIDDDIVTQKGGATAATNYITGLFNQSFVLYTNESIALTISEILAWTTVSPYTGSSSSQMLTSFQNLTGEFNGNVGHLVSYQTSGGIAVVDGLCQTNPDWRKCFSAITSSYLNVPTYSWSVMVVTHEMGHVIGSKHTHACAWNGNNTAIDGCSGVEGSCPLPPIPAGGGTIMSYCHIQNVGINFTLGFGPQPGNIIRNRVNGTGNCLTPCGPPPPPPPPSYCPSNGSNSAYEYINKVVLGSINNTSGNSGGYGNFTALTTNLTRGSAYTINLTPGFPSGAFTE
ncbi:MAG TPA: M12 family metallo-peptidase, partial [Saprospiraceae bacterium]|nr:M12 family metallo-peptidase [Saprospiraceae bacterium]